jgi:hypothetical protein
MKFLKTYGLAFLGSLLCLLGAFLPLVNVVMWQHQPAGAGKNYMILLGSLATIIIGWELFKASLKNFEGRYKNKKK